MKNLFFCLVGAFLFIVSCAGPRSAVKVDVVKASSLDNATQNAIVYHLPQTTLRIEVEVEKAVMKAGPYYRYAERLLNISDVIIEDGIEWRIRSFKIIPVGKADQAQCYAIKMKGAGVAQNVTINQQGVLCGINLTNYQQDCESSVLFEQEKELTLADVNFNEVPKLEKMLKQTSTAAMAEEAANYIYKIRKRRSKILSANFPVLPPDGQSLELSKNELDSLELQFMELFVGKKEVQTITRVIEYIPERVNPENSVLFRFSKQSGVVDKMDLSGAPVYIEVKNQNTSSLPDVETKKDKSGVSHGLYFCKPGKAVVRLIDKNILMLEQEVDIAQFGQVVSMPSSLLERKNVTIELNPSSGSLKRLQVAD